MNFGSNASNPPTLQDLKEFYVSIYTPLYDRFINEGAVAQELHAEVSAALDHLLFGADSSTGIIDGNSLYKAAGHLKRATFDGFKIIFENSINKPYRLLMEDCYSEVHDGKFRSEITSLWKKAQTIACGARNLERRSHGYSYESWDKAFAKWNEIIPIADKFSAYLVAA